MKDLWQYLKTVSRPVVLYGTGDGADKIMEVLARNSVPVSGVFASDGFVRERTFRGFRVMSYEECRAAFPGMIVLMCFGSSRPEVLANAAKIASECEFYAPDVPVAGGELFDAAFFEAHEKELAAARSLLADEKSTSCFDCHVAFKLSGDPSYLKRCETSRGEIEREFFRLENARLLDLGAYNGDTALTFTQLNPSYVSVTAVEPDPRNCRKLAENTACLHNVTVVNAAAGEADGEVFFTRSKGRGARISRQGERIPCRSADSLLRDLVPGSAVYLKADVEGNELNVIEGARRVIGTLRPVMSVACYHRSADLFRIPLAVCSVRPDYRVYMRHSPHIPAWDTEFYFL